MRVPLSWLAEYVDLPGDATPESVMAELVKVGLEEEGSHGFDVTGPVVVGQVLEFTPEEQSNGKTIRWCQVRVAPAGSKAADGGEDIRGIVCGASNFEVGDKVVVCLPGAVLPGGFAIAARKTYGHVSDGMMASARELTLSDDHAGIIRLHELGLDPKVGTDALELLQLSEAAAEVNVTPDRGYCFSIRGIAREYSHATGSEFRDPIGNAHPESVSGFELTIDDQAPIRDRIGSEHFTLRAVKNIDATRPTPPWMVARLKLAGMRSISLVVDITNYVMLELGQPLHAYDLDKLTGGITVRRAAAGETLKTLDGQQRKLHVEDLLICDESGPIGLAGVMGGETTEVSLETKNVLIEAAHFDPISIARSARRHKLPSEASKRFERGVDPNIGPAAVARVIQLLEVHAHGEADFLGAEFRTDLVAKPIWLPAEFAEQHVGVEYTADEIIGTLSQIGCVVATVDGGFEVIAPSWRPDLTHKTDLVEEVARITGYDRIPSRIPVAPPGRGLTSEQRMRRQVLNQLAATGHVEVLNYPFLNAAANRWFAADSVETVKLANALQGDLNEMRVSLLPGLLEAAKRNLSRGLTDLALVEEGRVFLPANNKAVAVLPSGVELPSQQQLDELNASIPNQPRHLALALLGNRVQQQVGQSAVAYDYSDALQAAKLAAHAVGVQLIVKQAAPKGFHPGRTAQLFADANGQQISIGYAGELDPQLTVANDLPRRVAAVELNLDALFAAAPQVVQAQHVYTMPAATQDLSLVVDASTTAAELEATIVEGAGELLEAIRLVDDYRGENVGQGKKSLTFALRFRAADRTLTQAEATDARDLAVKLATERFGAELRA
ncbi:MAG: phenylalanine--tRNA ligase subunit beta [Actinomycetales bacterium]|nr:phenylalanine--tRNA ligase subunit beta [Actinomycetales bacterium]